MISLIIETCEQSIWSVTPEEVEFDGEHGICNEDGSANPFHLKDIGNTASCANNW